MRLPVSVAYHSGCKSDTMQNVYQFKTHATHDRFSPFLKNTLAKKKTLSPHPFAYYTHP